MNLGTTTAALRCHHSLAQHAGLEPVYGIILGALFLHEIPGLRTVLGSLAVFGAVFLAMKAHTSDAGLEKQAKEDD